MIKLKNIKITLIYMQNHHQLIKNISQLLVNIENIK